MIGPPNYHTNRDPSEINLKGNRFHESGLEENLPISPEIAKSWLQSMSIGLHFKHLLTQISAVRQPKQLRNFITHRKGLYANDTVHRRQPVCPD